MDNIQETLIILETDKALGQPEPEGDLFEDRNSGHEDDNPMS